MNNEKASERDEECSPNESPKVDDLERRAFMDIGRRPKQKKRRIIDETSNKISDGFNTSASEFTHPLDSTEDAKDKKLQCETLKIFQSQPTSLNEELHCDHTFSAYQRSIMDKLPNTGAVDFASDDKRGLSNNFRPDQSLLNAMWLKTQYVKTRPDLELLSFIRNKCHQNNDFEMNHSMYNSNSTSVTANMAYSLQMMVKRTKKCDSNEPMLESPTGWPSFSHPARPHFLEDTRNRGHLLYFPTDDEFLSEQQIFIRKQIEFFESDLGDVGKTTSGRKHPTRLNQVGIQCRHCASLPLGYRERGAVYFPAKLIGIYQASQNIASFHMIQLCQLIDDDTKERLKGYKQCRSVSGHGGKNYWAETAKAQGVVESESGGGLRFQSRTTVGNTSLV